MVKYTDIYKLVYPRMHEGIYKNRGDNDYVSVRIRQGVGRDPSKWYSSQLRALAYLAREYGDGRIMLGTRGDVEIYRVRFSKVDELISRLKEVGLDPRDSCKNSVRNPIPCPSQFCPYAHIDAEALSTYISDYFRYRPEYEGQSIPHRVKISISACERACAVPVAQDVGIVAKANGKFDIYIGGGLGEHAFSAKLAFIDIDAEDILPICIGVAEVLKRSGERRGFKWIVKVRGLDSIKDEVLRVAREVKGKMPPPNIRPRFIKAKMAVIHYPTGWVSSDELAKIADLSDRYGFGFVVLFNDQTIYMPLREEATEVPELKGRYVIKEPGPFSPMVPLTVACVGNELCPPGLIDTTGIGGRIHVHVSNLKAPIRVGVSGCTHDCGMSWVSDIGFEPFGHKTRVLVTVGGSPKNLGVVLGTIDPRDIEETARVLVDVYSKSGVSSFRGLVEKYGADRLRDELARHIASFQPPGHEVKSVFGPD